MSKFRKLSIPSQSSQSRVIFHVDQIFSKPISRKELIKNKFLSQLPFFMDPCSIHSPLSFHQMEALNLLAQNANKISSNLKKTGSPRSKYLYKKTKITKSPEGNCNSPSSSLFSSTSSLENESATSPNFISTVPSDSSPIQTSSPMVQNSPLIKSVLGKRDPSENIFPKRGRPRKKPLVSVNTSPHSTEAPTSPSPPSPISSSKSENGTSPSLNSPVKLTSTVGVKCPICGEEKQTSSSYQCILCNHFYHTECLSSIVSFQPLTIINNTTISNNNTVVSSPSPNKQLTTTSTQLNGSLSSLSQSTWKIQKEEKICNQCLQLPALCTQCSKPEPQNGEKLLPCYSCYRLYHSQCFFTSSKQNEPSILICEQCRLSPTEVKKKKKRENETKN